MPALTVPSDEALDAFLSLTLAQRGVALLAMTPSARIAFAVAYSRRDGCQPYRALDRFYSWQMLAADHDQEARS